jgi:FixJ family two-component response regulator
MNRNEYVVFLVDNDPAVRKALGRSLVGKSCHVRAFSSAHDFLLQHDRTVHGSPIFDVFIPDDRDGFELQAKLSADRGDRPVILITGNGEVPTDF